MSTSGPTDGADAGADLSQPKAASLSGALKIAVEFGPLAVFFAAFQIGGLMVATAAFMAAMLLAVAFSYFKTRHVSPMLWVNFALISIMGGLTLALNDETFVKMKPTLLFFAFALALTGAERFDRLLLKSVMGGAMPPLPDLVWRKLTWSLSGAYVCAALINEWVWRSFSTETWVTVKVFGMLPGMMLVTAGLTMAFILPHLPDEPEDPKP